MNRDESRRADARVLAALDAPRTTTELTFDLRRELWETWAEETGIDLEYNERGLPTNFGARLSAYSYAAQKGTPMLSSAQVYNRLVKLEKAGLVQRLMMPNHTRSILWFRPRSTTAEALDG